MYMNTKRQKRQKQSKKVKRKTKTYKKRNIRKYGGGDEIYLKSSINHGFPFKPVYKFITTSEVGKGSNAISYLGKILCDVNESRNCIKTSSINLFSSSREKSELTDLSQTLQSMYYKTNPEGEGKFPYDKKYILRVYGKKLDQFKIEQEIHGTENHRELSKDCSSFVCTLFDYGEIVDKNTSYLTNKKYKSKQGKGLYAKCTNDNENCVYALLEKGEMDMMEYLDSIRDIPDDNEKKKILYIIAIKMIRNIHCLHSKNMMHYDIKLENCVFFPKGETQQLEVGEDIVNKFSNLQDDIVDNDVKLIDFGFCSKLTKENYMKNRIVRGSPACMYIDNWGRNRVILLNSGFPDIYAILKDIDMVFNTFKLKISSEIFGNFKRSTVTIKNYEGIQFNLPKFLNTQRKLLQNMSEYNFTHEPYQNILNKLKEEYLDLDRPSPWW